MRDIPLVEIPMSVRLDNILRKAGYSNLQQIDKHALEKIKAQRGCGKRSFNELLKILEFNDYDQHAEWEQTWKEHQTYLNAIIDFKLAFYKLVDLANINWSKIK